MPSKILVWWYQQISGTKSAGEIADGDRIHTFNSAKAPHSSHSFFTCVIPPISKTAGFPISTDEAGEAVRGEGSEDVGFDMLIQQLLLYKGVLSDRK
jgi:hypothetical protein